MRANRSESTANRDLAAGRRIARPAPRAPGWSLSVVTVAKWAAVLIVAAVIVGEFIR